MLISTAYAQAAPAAATGGTDLLTGMLPIALMFVVLYFLMIRPQMKRQKEAKAMLEALAKGDEVVTIGGILGKITKIGDNVLHIEVASGVEVQIERGAVAKTLMKGTIK
ncbi:MAG: preprotein translocase subunit YajC [Betaproteobacteria bacterium]|nr:preprotein translocase subunit YajC [Betaproteobacteria bacterium]MDE2049124.1 preprotein translocase subunit YajC [Betaproteobacteria bacterium]